MQRVDALPEIRLSNADPPVYVHVAVWLPQGVWGVITNRDYRTFGSCL